MDRKSHLAELIASIGFRCRRCGACCSGTAAEPLLVHVTSDEIQRIVIIAKKPWDKVAEPYTEYIERSDGSRITFGWQLCTSNGRCNFHFKNRCMIYGQRPWICRTYPFMLNGDRLVVSECKGLGNKMCKEESLALAEALIRRKSSEDQEYTRVKKMLSTTQIPMGALAVIDSSGVRVFHG